MHFCLLLYKKNLFPPGIWTLSRTFVISGLYFKQMLHSILTVMVHVPEKRSSQFNSSFIDVTADFCRTTFVPGLHLAGMKTKSIYHKYYSLYENSVTYGLASSQLMAARGSTILSPFGFQERIASFKRGV